MMNTTKILDLFKRLTNYALLISVLIAGFFIGRISTEIFQEKKSSEPPPIKTINDISIAVNESNDMLIIDRRDGTYEMYSDTVGLTIFRMYASRIKSQMITEPIEKNE